jgi:hypothetical protein
MQETAAISPRVVARQRWRPLPRLVPEHTGAFRAGLETRLTVGATRQRGPQSTGWLQTTLPDLVHWPNGRSDARTDTHS